MVLVVGVIVDGDVMVALAIQQLADEVVSLLQITLAICRGMVGTWQPRHNLARVWSVISPANRPSSISREVAVGWIPV